MYWEQKLHVHSCKYLGLFFLFAKQNLHNKSYLLEINDSETPNTGGKLVSPLTEGRREETFVNCVEKKKEIIESLKL